jgi:hypothetical protein
MCGSSENCEFCGIPLYCNQRCCQNIHYCSSKLHSICGWLQPQFLCLYQCTCNGGLIFWHNSTKAATSSTVSHTCAITPYQTSFFIRTSNFASLLTHQHCLLPQSYCFWWNWQNTEQNVQCSSLSLYRQTVYRGKYSGYCVVLVLLIERLLFWIDVVVCG